MAGFDLASAVILVEQSNARGCLWRMAEVSDTAITRWPLAVRIFDSGVALSGERIEKGTV
jgi:hypothetical protein